MFCIYIRTNSDLCHLQHKLIGFYKRDEKCLLRGTDGVFKYSGLRFVFRRLSKDRLTEQHTLIVFTVYGSALLNTTVQTSRILKPPSVLLTESLI